MQLGRLQKQVATQTTSVRCLANSLEVQIRSLLNVLGSVQSGWCKNRPPPMLVNAIVSKPFGGAAQFTVGRGRLSPVRVLAGRHYCTTHLSSLPSIMSGGSAPFTVGCVIFGQVRGVQAPTNHHTSSGYAQYTLGGPTHFNVGRVCFNPVRVLARTGQHTNHLSSVLCKQSGGSAPFTVECVRVSPDR